MTSAVDIEHIVTALARLRSAGPRVRTMACYALGLRGDDIAVPILESVLRDPSRLDSHATAAWSLGVLHHQQAESALVDSVIDIYASGLDALAEKPPSKRRRGR